MKLNTKALANVQFGRIVVGTGSYLCRINGKVEPNKSKTGYNYVLQHTVLDEKVVTHDGKEIANNGNIKITKWISLQPNEAGTYDPDAVIKELAVAAGIYTDDADVLTEDLDGKIVKAKVKFRDAEKGNPESNDINGWKALTDEERAIAEASPF